MFDAPFRVPQIVKGLLGTDTGESTAFAAIREAVEAEHGVTLPSLGAVIDDELSEAFPYASVLDPDGRVTSATKMAIDGSAELWVFITDRDLDIGELRKRRNGYLVALGRMFINRRADDRSWHITVSEWLASPPFSPTDTTYLMVSGVKLLVTMAESAQ